jgi:hypothetical protein
MNNVSPLFQACMTQGVVVQYYNTSQNWVFLGLAGGIFGGLSSYVLLKGKFSQYFFKNKKVKTRNTPQIQNAQS